jgi:hypothetical protein
MMNAAAVFTRRRLASTHANDNTKTRGAHRMNVGTPVRYSLIIKCMENPAGSYYMPEVRYKDVQVSFSRQQQQNFFPLLSLTPVVERETRI